LNEMVSVSKNIRRTLRNIMFYLHCLSCYW